MFRLSFRINRAFVRRFLCGLAIDVVLRVILVLILYYEIKKD